MIALEKIQVADVATCDEWAFRQQYISGVFTTANETEPQVNSITDMMIGKTIFLYKL